MAPKDGEFSHEWLKRWAESEDLHLDDPAREGLAFEGLRRQGIKPEQLSEHGRKRYEAWLAAHPE